jgi:hypothetical protein
VSSQLELRELAYFACNSSAGVEGCRALLGLDGEGARPNTSTGRSTLYVKKEILNV